ncbi:hypothetical protein BC941DRAFT_452287 [Chlamydoabsidia padenii]|nr:hypothetical protein BC941DRAFT_452287 [Chlamydoabsidia padenii]
MPIFKDHPCEVCGTSRYKKTSDGGYVCKYGHQMVGYREEQGEENSMLGVRVTKRKKVANTDTNVKHSILVGLYGAELEDAYVRIFQFSLQVMAQSFITDLGFPAEYEYAIRELWLLYVRSSNLTLVNAHIINSDSKPNITSASKLFMAANNPEDLLNETDSDSDVDDKNSITIQKYEPTTPTVDDIKPRRLNHSTGWPITINDIRRWCLTMRLPYLRIINLIPDRSINLLDLRPAMAMLRFPENEAIRGDVSIYVNAFVIKCGLTLPKFNVSPLIFRYCTQLFLPVEIYFCAVELYKKHSYEAIINRHSKYDENTPCPNHFYHDIDNHIMVVILVLAKFLYDLDDKDNTWQQLVAKTKRKNENLLCEVTLQD